jgi:hypothetical protein
MTDNPNIPGGDTPEGRLRSSLSRATNPLNTDDPPMPSSKPLQIFLLIAFVITGAAYVTNEWIEYTTEKAHAKYPSRLHELVKSQSLFLEHTDAGKKALARKHPDQAVDEFRLALQASKPLKAIKTLRKHCCNSAI